jgi:TP901 family phage tail tape measure protein
VIPLADAFIQLIAQLDEGKSKVSIDEQIKKIESKLSKINLKVAIDDKVLNTLKEFSSAIQKVNDVIKYQNQVVKQNIEIKKELDGSTTRVEKSELRNGEIIEKTTKIINDNTNAIAANAEAKKNLAKIVETTVKGEPSTVTEVYKDNNFNQEIIKKSAKTQEEITRTTINNIEKRNKYEQDLIEQMERFRLESLRRRQQRELEWEKAQADAINKYKIQQYNEEQAELLRIQRLGTLKLSNLDVSKFNKEGLTEYLKSIYGINAEIQKLQQTTDSTGKKIWDFTVNVKTGKDTFDQFKGKIDETSKAIYQNGDVVQKTLNRNLGVIEQLKIALERFPIWIIASTLTMEVIHSYQNAIEYIQEMDSALVELNKVVDMSASDMANMRDVAISLGKELGRSSVEIMQSMAEWGRSYKNLQDIQELARASVMAANVTTMSAAEAAKSLNTAIITFGLSAKDAISILDQWNEIQNNFRTNVEDLAESISAVGAAAKQAGVSIQELEGYTTAIVTATGLQGSEVGTALKSMISRVYRIGPEGEEDAGKAEQVLNSIGVAVRKNATEFRSFNDILSDISKKWNSLTNIQQQNIAQAMAGTYHYSKFMALMNNFQTAIDATSKAYNSQNSALNENEKYLNSIEGRIQIFRTSVEELNKTIVSSDFLKGLVDTGTGLINILENTIKTFGVLGTMIIGLGTAISIFKAKAITSFVAATGSINVFTLATKLATLAVGELNVALNFLKAHPIVLAVTGITTALVVFANVIQNAKKAQEAFIQKTDEQINKLKQQQSTLQDLRETYAELSGKPNLSTDEQQQLIDVQNKIAEIAPELVSAYDAEGNAIIKNTTALDDYIQKLREEQAEKEKSKRSAYVAQLEDEAKKIDDIKRKISGEQFGPPGQYYIPISDEELNKLNEQLRSKNEQYQKLRDNIKNTVPDFNLLDGVTKKIAENLAQVVDKKFPTLNTSNVEEYARQIENIAKTLKEQNIQAEFEKYQELTNEYKKGNATLKEVQAEYDKLKNILTNLFKQYGLAESNINTFLVNIVENATKLKQSFDFGSSLKNFIDSTNDLASAYQTLSNGQQLSLDQIQKLIEAHPQLTSALVVENGQLTLNKDTIYEIIKAKEQDYKVSLEKTLKSMLDEAGLQADINELRAKGINLLYTEAKVKYLTNWQDRFPSLSATYTQMREDLSGIESIINEINLLSKIDLTKQITTPTKSSSKSKSSKEPYQSQIEATRGLQLAIQDLENEIQKYQTLADIASSDQQRIQYLNRINDLLQQQKNRLHELNNALRQERDGLGLQIERYKVAGRSVADFDEKTKKLNINRVLYNKLSDEQKQKIDDLVEKFDELTKEIESNSNKWFELNKNIQGNNYDIMSIKLEEAKQRIADIDNQIDISKLKMQQYNKTSKQYNDEQQKQIILLKQKQDVIKNVITLLNSLISVQGLTADQVKQLNNLLQDYQKELLNTNNLISDYINSVFDAYHNHIIDSLRDQIKQWQNTKEEAKKAAQEKIDAIQAEIDVLQKENDELKEQEERQKRLDEIAKQRELIANIEKEKNVRIIQNGEWVYIADPKKLADETEKLKELENDYNRWEQNNQRQHVIEQKRQQIKDIQDELKIEQDKYDTKIKRLQDFINIEQKKLNKQKEFQITNLTELMDALKGIESSAYSDRLTALQDFIDKYNKLASQLGLPELNVPTLKTVSTGSSSSKGAKGYNETNNNEINSILDKMAKNSQNWHNVSDSEKKKLAQENQRLGEELRKKGVDAQYNPSTGKWNVLKYDEGGVIDYTGLAMVHGKPNNVEVVFNAEQGKKLYDFVRFVIPKLQIPNIIQSKEQFIQNFNFHIDKVETKDADSFLKLAKTLVIQYTS